MVLLTATNLVLGAGAIAAFRAASMRARMAAQIFRDVHDGRETSKTASSLNASLLVLVTDDDRLADPFAAALRLPKGSMVIVRARDAERRQALAESLRAQTRGLILLAADDPVLADRLHGLHLPEKRARDAAHWRALRPHWLITVAAHSACALHIAYADAALAVAGLRHQEPSQGASLDGGSRAD